MSKSKGINIQNQIVLSLGVKSLTLFSIIQSTYISSTWHASVTMKTFNNILFH